MVLLKLFQKVSNTYGTPGSVAHRATNEELFGPSTEDLQQLTKLTFKPKSCAKILRVLEHRFQQSDRHWRQKSKALTVLQFFIIHGSPTCVKWVQDHDELIRQLVSFHYVDSRNNDQGSSVRDKAESLLQVSGDPKKLKEAKLAYKKQREVVRKSIGTGRPSTQSRNTLEMMRDNIFDDTDASDINGLFQSTLQNQSPYNSAGNTSNVDLDPNTSVGGLCAIEEEH